MFTMNERSTVGVIATVVVLFISSVNTKAQDPEFSQFYASPIYTNPAMAGTGNCLLTGGAGRAAVNYRNQWPSLGGAFTTTAVSLDQHFGGIGGGLGLIAMHDVAGEGLLTTNSLSGIYSYLLPVNRKLYMRFGLEAQIMQRGLDFDKLDWEDELVGNQGFVGQTSEAPITNRITSPNFSTGWVVYTDNLYAGIAVHNVIEPVQSFYGDRTARLPRRYTVHMGSVIKLDKRGRSENTVSPNVLFMKQAEFTQMNVGFYFNRGPLVTGMWFRQTFGEFANSDALMMLVGIKKDKFKFGYSYDLTVDSKRSAARGSHEISTTIEWCPKKRTPKFKNLPCPW